MRFLGFVIYSTEMTLKLTESKQKKIFTLCDEVIKSKIQSVRKIDSRLGNIAALFEAVPLGPLHNRSIKICKIAALKAAKGNYECKMSILPTAKIEIAWWIDNIYTSYRSIEEMPITDVVYTDALIWVVSYI